MAGARLDLLRIALQYPLGVALVVDTHQGKGAVGLEQRLDLLREVQPLIPSGGPDVVAPHRLVMI
jgi:hypothetical protein